MRGTPDIRREGAGRAVAGWPMLVLLLGACYAVAAIGTVASADAGRVYDGLERPAWAPPGWLFGPVWTVLYATIAVSAWLVLRRPAQNKAAMTCWSVQLLLNLAWTPLFFSANAYGLAFADICLLFAAILATMVVFGRIRRSAALLLLPYLAWVSFAAALNLDIWLRNA